MAMSTEPSLTIKEPSLKTKKPLSADADYSFRISFLSEKEVKELKLPLSDWQQHLEHEQAERNRKGVIAFLEKKIATGPLLPDTTDCQLLFEKLAVEAEAKGRCPPGVFPTLACKTKFTQAAGRLNGTLETAIDSALEQGITAIPKVVNYVASPKWQNQNGGTTSDTIGQRQGNGSESQSGTFSKTQDKPSYGPPIGSGQTPEMRSRLKAAFGG